MIQKSKTISQKERDLILARLEVLSKELHFASGSGFEDFSRDDMIKQIKNNTEIGKKFVVTELEFLKAVKDGSLIKTLTVDN